MADGYDQLQLVGRHVPDANGGPFKTIQEAQAAGHDTINPVTGVYQVGVLVDGVFVPIMEDAAARFQHHVDAAKASEPAPQEQPPQETNSTSTQPTYTNP